MTTTRLRDTAFKRVLRTMPFNAQVKIEGPFGNLIPHINATDAAFLELQALQTRNQNYKLVATVTEIDKSARLWKGEVGMIECKILDRHLKAAASAQWYTAGPIYYIAGPPRMVRD